MANKKDFSAAGRGILGLDKSADSTIDTTEIVDVEYKASIAKKQDLSNNQTTSEIKIEKVDTSRKIRERRVKELTIKTTVELSEENAQFIEDIKIIEGGSVKTVLNGLLDDLRKSKRAALDKALEIHKQGRKTWKDL